MKEDITWLKMEEAASFLKAMVENWILTPAVTLSSELGSTLSVLFCQAALGHREYGQQGRAHLSSNPVMRNFFLKHGSHAAPLIITFSSPGALVNRALGDPPACVCPFGSASSGHSLLRPSHSRAKKSPELSASTLGLSCTSSF